MALHAQPQEKSQTPDHSRDTLTQTTAESTTSALRASPENMAAQSELSSRSATLTAQETAKTQKMFPAGELNFFFFII
jgi:hypothetical protein